MPPLPRDPDAYALSLRVPPPPGSPYALPIPGSHGEGRTPVYRHWRFVDGPVLHTLDPEALTAHASFEKTAQRRPNNRCLGVRPWDPATRTYGNKFQWITYGEVAERRKNFGAGIVELHRLVGVSEEKYGVGVWSQNRPEWQIADLGCTSQRLFTVSIYDTLGPDTAEYIVNHASLACVVTSLPHLPTLIKLAPRIPTLKIIVCMDPIDAGEKPGYSKGAILKSLAADAGLQIHYLGDVEALGAASQLPMRPPRPDDVCTINYTSGTTGNPKGVVLTHANAVGGVTCARVSSEYKPTDVLLSYLPLAHIYQRVAEQACFSAGAALGYWRGDILGLIDDLKVLRPQGLNSVPRLYNRFGSAIRQNTIDQPGFKGVLSRHVINAKMASMKLPVGQATNKNAFYDRIWTSKVASAFGLQRCRTMISGAAPLDPTLHRFLRAAFGTEIVQGFGMTETYAVSFVQLAGDYSVGNCGPPHPGLEACLQSVPDMDYLVTDTPNPRGELLVRGSPRFREYFKNPEETAKCIDSDGWFATGDIAEIDSMGRFAIIDRRKNVLKLAQGEYISPERIENVYMANSNILSQAYVHGDSTQAFLVSIFGVDPVTFAPFASSILHRTITPTDVGAIKAACKEPKIRQAILKQLDDIGQKNKFNSYEKVRACWLEIDPFTIENELLTPTMKLKRAQTAKRFKDVLNRLHEEVQRVKEGSKGKIKAML